MTIIHTDRLVIRESSGKDFSRIYAMMLSVAPEETTDAVSPDENEELEKYLAYIHNCYSIFGFGLWSVCLKAPAEMPGADTPESGPDPYMEGELIGRCGLQPIADENSPLGRIELGYLIDERFRGAGYGYEACSAVISYAFRNLEIDELYVKIAPGNAASGKLAEKLGFVRTPQEKDLWVLRNPYREY